MHHIARGKVAAVNHKVLGNPVRRHARWTYRGYTGRRGGSSWCLEIIKRTGAGAASAVARIDKPTVLLTRTQGGSGGRATGVDCHYRGACGDVSNIANVKCGSAGGIPAHSHRAAAQCRPWTARRARTQVGRGDGYRRHRRHSETKLPRRLPIWIDYLHTPTMCSGREIWI